MRLILSASEKNVSPEYLSKKFTLLRSVFQWCVSNKDDDECVVFHSALNNAGKYSLRAYRISGTNVVVQYEAHEDGTNVYSILLEK